MNKKTLKVGLLQETDRGSVEANLDAIEAALRDAAAAGVELVLLQELHNGPYFCQQESVDEFDRAESIPGPSTKRIGALAEELQLVVVASLFERRAAGLPPFSHLALLRADALKLAQAEDFLDSAGSLAEQMQITLNCPGVELLGPVPAPMERRAGRHRAQLLLQASSRASLHRLLSPWLQALEQLPGSRSVRWSLDVDPTDLF